MPPLPPPEGMHVLVVHFPIALLNVAALFVLIGALTGFRSMMVSALILMGLGLAGVYVSISTGDAAYNVMEPGEYDEEGDDPYDVAELHIAKANQARNWFTGLTATYAVLLLLTAFTKKFGGMFPRIVLHLVFLAIWAYPLMVLANAAHEGGRLVHEFGVRSPLAETAEPVAEPVTKPAVAPTTPPAEATITEAPITRAPGPEASEAEAPADEPPADKPAAPPMEEEAAPATEPPAAIEEPAAPVEPAVEAPEPEAPVAEEKQAA